MDINGRQRASIPGSSTFRRLPTLTRSPFRRAEKNASPPPQEPEPVSRTSAFPSLARVVVDDTSLSSALFGSGGPIPSIHEDQQPAVVSPTTASQGHSTRQQQSPKRPPPLHTTSSATSTATTNTFAANTTASTATPSANASPIISGSKSELASPQPIANPTAFYSTPVSSIYTPRAPSAQQQHQQQHRVPMPSSAVPAVGSSPAGFELEPITYPAHLAQTRPPQEGAVSKTPPPPAGGPSTGTPAGSSSPQVISASVGGTPGSSGSGGGGAAAPAVPARSAHRYRDFTLGTSQAAFASAMNLTTSNLSASNVNANNGSANPPTNASMSGINGTQSPAAEQSGVSSLSSGVRRPSASGGRKPSVASTPQGPSTRDRRDKEDVDSPDNDSAKRRPAEAATRSRRPPKARERDPSKLPVEDDGDAILAPVLPAAKVGRAPASAMYFSPVAAHGRPPGQALRAHTGTLVGDRIWFLGGVDARSCWRGVANFDTESLQWSTIETHGEALPPLRAHTTTLVDDHLLYIFGGGDGPTYSNDVWVFDTITHRFSRPVIATPRGNLPPPRRAHTTVLYRHWLVVFGGGNGQAALNDVWALDVSDPTRLTWHEWRTRGDVPQKKGYHTANLVGDKMIVFGGSDGHASFADVHVLNLQNMTWTLVPTEVKHNRLSHTATQVGSYLFVIGGHNGQTYAQDVLLFNLTTLAWESKVPKGIPPPGRGYHVAVLHDARIFISGGYNGVSVFEDLWSLDLGAGAYLPQVTTFEVNEQSEHLRMMGPGGTTKNGAPGGRI